MWVWSFLPLADQPGSRNGSFLGSLSFHAIGRGQTGTPEMHPGIGVRNVPGNVPVLRLYGYQRKKHGMPTKGNTKGTIQVVMPSKIRRPGGA